MTTFFVTWHLDFYEIEVQRTTVWEMEAESFESLLTRLDSGLEEGEFCPENEFLELQGNFNLEYARIVDSTGKELLIDPDLNLT